MKYTREIAFSILEKIEPIFAREQMHLALGGSVMYKGWSDKDIDIIIYPRKEGLDQDSVMHLLDDLGFSKLDEISIAVEYPIDVIHTLYGPDKIKCDFFLMQRHGQL